MAKLFALEFSGLLFSWLPCRLLRSQFLRARLPRRSFSGGGSRRSLGGGGPRRRFSGGGAGGGPPVSRSFINGQKAHLIADPVVGMNLSDGNLAVGAEPLGDIDHRHRHIQ